MSGEKVMLSMSEMSLLNYLKEQYNDITALSPDEILKEAFEYENELDATSMYDVLDIDEEKIFSYIHERNDDENEERKSRRRRR